MEHLQSAVVGYSWAKEAFCRSITGDLSYQALFSQLIAAEQFDQEEKLGRIRKVFVYLRYMRLIKYCTVEFLSLSIMDRDAMLGIKTIY